MSKGLGKLQREIITMLEHEKDGCASYDSLVVMLQFHEPGVWRGMVDQRELMDYEPSVSFYQSVGRAIRTLKKKGIVSTFRVQESELGQGGRTYYTKVKCLVHGNITENSTLNKQTSADNQAQEPVLVESK